MRRFAHSNGGFHVSHPLNLKNSQIHERAGFYRSLHSVSFLVGSTLQAVAERRSATTRRVELLRRIIFAKFWTPVVRVGRLRSQQQATEKSREKG